MPQMSPMVWVMFPFVMVLLLLISMTTLNEEMNMNKNEEGDMVGKVKHLMW